MRHVFNVICYDLPARAQVVKLNGPSVRISSLSDAVLDHHIAMVCCGVEDVRHYRATARQVESSPIHVELKLLTQIGRISMFSAD